MVYRHSSVDSSAPTVLLPQVRVPSTPSTLVSFIVKFVLNVSCEKNENKQQEAELGQFKKTHSNQPRATKSLPITDYKKLAARSFAETV